MGRVPVLKSLRGQRFVSNTEGEQGGAPTTASPTAFRYVFVGGLHRSGTSLTADLLAAAPGATGLSGTGHMEDEGHYLHDVIPSALTYGGPGRFAFDDQCQLAPSADPDGDRTRILGAWEGYWGDPTAPVRIEKSPQNLVQARWLQSVVPGSQFVMVIRHPAAVALATMKWTRPGPPKLRRLRPTASMQSLLEHWVVAHERFAADRPFLDSVEVVRFREVLDGSAIERMETVLGLEIKAAAGHRDDTVYAQRWAEWRASREGVKAAKTWLPAIAEAIAPWGYGLDDDLV